MLQVSDPERSGDSFWIRFPQPWAGLDEAGRGCLAGPVVAAAVILPDTWNLPGLTDSKKLSARRREALEPMIKAQAVAWSLGVSWPREIERINILRASLLAMARAVGSLKVAPRFLAVDGNQPTPLDIPQRTVTGGDRIVPSISAASILAKTFRDRLMAKLDKRHPGYGFAEHKGYGVASHTEAIRRLGPSPMHRMTFRGVAPETEVQACLPGISS